MDRQKRWPKGTWMQLRDRGELIEQMQRRRFSLEKLARYAGCSKGMVSHLTSGRRTTCSPVLAAHIAEALEVSVTMLFVPKVSTAQGQIAKSTRTKVAA